jgi:hypothetical protein
MKTGELGRRCRCWRDTLLYDHIRPKLKLSGWNGGLSGDASDPRQHRAPAEARSESDG